MKTQNWIHPTDYKRRFTWTMTTKLYTKYIDVKEQVWVGGFIDVGSLGLSRSQVWTLLCKPIWSLMAIISCRSFFFFFFFFSLSNFLLFILNGWLSGWVSPGSQCVGWAWQTWMFGFYYWWLRLELVVFRLCDLRLLMTEVTNNNGWLVGSLIVVGGRFVAVSRVWVKGYGGLDVKV